MAAAFSQSLLLFVLCTTATIIVQTPFAVSAEEGDKEPPKPPTTPKPPKPPTTPAPPPKEASPDDSKKNCKVASFKTQQDFDVEEYMGPWYAISDMGMFPYQHTFDWLFYALQDAKSYYQANQDGSITATSAGRVLGYCRRGEGVATVEDEDGSPAKLMISYPDSWYPLPKNPIPYWIIATDYEFAVIYSCQKVLEDGTCDPKQTFSWTLNRDADGHDDDQQAAIDKKLEDLCLDPKKFIKMPRHKPCPELEVDEDDYEDGKGEL